MPWNKKTKTASDWKPVRVRKEWLDVVREAGELQPIRASPTLDLTTCSEPKLLEYACKLQRVPPSWGGSMSVHQNCS